MGKSLKSLIIIPLIVAASIGAAAVLLISCGVRFKPVDPIAAAAVCAVAGALGMVPSIRSGRNDPVSVVQTALVGTIVHLIAASVFAITLIVTHVVDARGGFAFWALGGYWVSLMALIWQLRRVLTATFRALPTAGTAKVQ